MSDHHDAPDGFDGEVTVAVDGAPDRTAHATLAARFDPLAGHVVWSGRVRLELAPRTELTITTPHGVARAEVAERDVWGNARVRGLGRPPFPVELLDGTAS
ncbi:MAG: DUF4873 domain-containing protein [Blastococcus sp.]